MNKHTVNIGKCPFIGVARKDFNFFGGLRYVDVIQLFSLIEHLYLIGVRIKHHKNTCIN